VDGNKRLAASQTAVQLDIDRPTKSSGLLAPKAAPAEKKRAGRWAAGDEEEGDASAGVKKQKVAKAAAAGGSAWGDGAATTGVVRTGRRNRWDATPAPSAVDALGATPSMAGVGATPGGAGGGGGAWEVTPSGTGSAPGATPKRGRSRWDETPLVKAGLLLGTSTRPTLRLPILHASV
jgi:splicing factor 3B subunit 1